MARRGKVLIVEDQYFVAMDCEIQLEQAGYECAGIARNAQEALAMARARQPDLVLMDIRLGHGEMDDGLRAAIEIYERLGIRSLFASAHGDSATRRMAQRAYPLGWLEKPYSSESLVHAVDEAMSDIQHSGAH